MARARATGRPTVAVTDTGSAGRDPSPGSSAGAANGFAAADPVAAVGLLKKLAKLKGFPTAAMMMTVTTAQLQPMFRRLAKAQPLVGMQDIAKKYGVPL